MPAEEERPSTHAIAYEKLHIEAQCDAHTKRSRFKLQCKRRATRGEGQCRCHVNRVAHAHHTTA